MKRSTLSILLHLLTAAIIAVNCSQDDGGNNTAGDNDYWTWVAGTSKQGDTGSYVNKGIPSPSSCPKVRYSSMSWKDSSGNLWLFGGSHYEGTSSSTMNDLWKFDGTNWTWISNNSSSPKSGVYGTQGVADAANYPGARFGGMCWTDSAGNLWLFGGRGFSSVYGETNEYLNDLWKFDGTNWTWIAGSNAGKQPGVYGNKGEAASANYPGARCDGVYWTDSEGNLWLFGGTGYGSSSSAGAAELNDLWKFDGTNWAWIGGSNTINSGGSYGIKGTASSTNTPGARTDFASWKDSSGCLWIFGGYGRDGAGTSGILNDLWKFDGTNWTWVSGSDTTNSTGNYGTRGVASASNIPGARQQSKGCVDSSGNLWLFGGSGRISSDSAGNLNDLWKFDGTNWTWVSGSMKAEAPGSYGTKGVTSTSNIPGGKSSPEMWIDSTDNLWIFGGLRSYVTSNGSGCYNDVWKCEIKKY